MLLLLQCVLGLLIFFVVRFVAGKFNSKRKSGPGYPPSLPSFPLVGSLPFLRNFENIPAFLLNKSKELGPIFTMQAGRKFILVLNSREVIEEALVKNSRSFSSRPEMYIEVKGNPNRKGIAFADTTTRWKRTHQTSLSILKEFGFGVKNIMEERILTEVEAMTEFVRKRGGKAFFPKELCTLISSNVMTNIVFGRRRDYDLGISEFVSEIDRLAILLDLVYDVAPFLRYIPPFNRKISDMVDWSRRMYATIEGETELSLQDGVSSSFVQRYIEKEGPNCDREELNYVIRDMISGGSNTTATTLLWAILALANHPDIQDRLREDIDSVLPRGTLPTMEDEAKLPYVTASIMELIRWRTLLPLSLLRNTTAVSTLSGFLIPADTMVIINLYAANSDPDTWNDPDVYRPERFLGDDNTVIGSDRSISFGSGRRSCFGETLARAEIFLLFTSLVQRFIILPPEEQPKIDDEVTEPVTITANPKPYSVRIIERQLG